LNNYPLIGDRACWITLGADEILGLMKMNDVSALRETSRRRARKEIRTLGEKFGGGGGSTRVGLHAN